MAKQPEAIFRAKAMTQLKALPHSWWTRIEQQAIVGTPDAVGCIRGMLVCIEFKSSRHARLTPMQKYNLDKVTKAGGISVCAWPENWELIYEGLHNFAQGNLTKAPDGTEFN